MENEVKFSAEETKELGVSADFDPSHFIDLSRLGTSLSGISLGSFFTPSQAATNGAGTYRFTGNSESGFNSSVTFQDIWSGYTGISQHSDYNYNQYDIGGYTNPNGATVTYQNHSGGSYSSDYSASTFYNVGNRNGYLNGYNQNTGVMNFVDVNITSWTRESDYVSFDMGNGTSFQAQTSNSTDDIFQYTTDGQNIHYAKLAKTDQDSSFNYTDGVTFIGSANHQDTLNLSTYDRSVDLRNGDLYINVDNIDASNSASTSYYQRNLLGNTGNNNIWAGNGDRLWGGAGNDNLYGGAGGNTYMFGNGDGNDVIYSSVSSDTIDLYNVSLENISGAGYDGSSLRLNLTGGESLTVVGQNGASNFRLQDGSEYSYNRSTDTWHQKI